MRLPLAYYGNPILRKKTEPVEIITDEIRQLVKDMEETVLALNGAGLAAPQIKKSLSIFITRVPLNAQDEDDEDDERETSNLPIRVYINPKIISYSDEFWAYPQGCLSIPGVYGIVVRPMHIKIEATDLEGNRFTEELSKLGAQAFMHENDHLNGVLFFDRLFPAERKAMEPALRKIKKKYENA